MAAKITSLVGLVVGSASLLTWGGFAFKDNYQYNSKMEEYGKWRKKFYEEQLKDRSLEKLVCENKIEQECRNGKAYFPKPNDYQDWEEVYKNLKTKDSEYADNELLKSINNPEDLKDYCFKELEKNLNTIRLSNPSSQDLCVLIPYPAQKLEQ